MKKPGVITHGTAKDLADSGVGYVAGGEGEYSRNSARPGRGINLADGGKRPRTDYRLIRQNEKALAKLERSMAVEADPAKLEKLRKSHAIKTRFIQRLQQGKGPSVPGAEGTMGARLNDDDDDERRPGKRSLPERVETLYGAEEFTPWDKV
jgi:hypothetical protein